MLIEPLETNLSKISLETFIFSLKKRIYKCRLENVGHFISASMC